MDGPYRLPKRFSCEYDVPRPALSDRLSSRYFTLFVIYTPYTIYKCELVEEPDALWLTPSILDSFLGWGKMVVRDGWKCE